MTGGCIASSRSFLPKIISSAGSSFFWMDATYARIAYILASEGRGP